MRIVISDRLFFSSLNEKQKIFLMKNTSKKKKIFLFTSKDDRLLKIDDMTLLARENTKEKDFFFSINW